MRASSQRSTEWLLGQGETWKPMTLEGFALGPLGNTLDSGRSTARFQIPTLGESSALLASSGFVQRQHCGESRHAYYSFIKRLNYVGTRP